MRWSRPEQVAVLLAAAAVLSGAAVFWIGRPGTAVRVFEQPPQAELVVQVDGAVLRPGLYRLPPGARAADAIAAAGGLLSDADPTWLNRARVLRDGERLTVPQRSASAAISGSATTPGDPRVDLNAASAQDLESLPGIGPVLAGRIVEHRRRAGPFQRLEDLLQVNGIGPRLLERVRPHVVIR